MSTRNKKSVIAVIFLQRPGSWREKKIWKETRSAFYYIIVADSRWWNSSLPRVLVKKVWRIGPTERKIDRQGIVTSWTEFSYQGLYFFRVIFILSFPVRKFDAHLEGVATYDGACVRACMTTPFFGASNFGTDLARRRGGRLQWWWRFDPASKTSSLGTSDHEVLFDRGIVSRVKWLQVCEVKVTHEGAFFL